MSQSNFSEWIKRDFIYITLLLVALFACVWTLGHTRQYINECNGHWAKQFEIRDNVCPCAETNKQAVPAINYRMDDDLQSLSIIDKED